MPTTDLPGILQIHIDGHRTESGLQLFVDFHRGLQEGNGDDAFRLSAIGPQPKDRQDYLLDNALRLRFKAYSSANPYLKSIRAERVYTVAIPSTLRRGQPILSVASGGSVLVGKRFHPLHLILLPCSDKDVPAQHHTTMNLGRITPPPRHAKGEKR